MDSIRESIRSEVKIELLKALEKRIDRDIGLVQDGCVTEIIGRMAQARADMCGDIYEAVRAVKV